MKQVDIIICTRNNEKLIGKCLDSVASQTFKNFNCIVVDDCSDDGTRDTIRRKYKWVRLIEKDAHTGPAISRNIAIENTGAEFVATIDSDAQLDKDWLKEQVNFIRRNGRIGIAASKIIYSWDRGKINSCGGVMTKLGFGFDRFSGARSSEKIPGSRVLYGHSAAMLVRRKLLDEIGLFDPAYFYGNEDTDIGWRTNIAGWDVAFNPCAIAYHDENTTVRRMPDAVAFHGTKNRIRSMIKNYSALNIAKFLPLHLAMVAGKIAAGNQKRPRVAALAWNIANFRQTLRERRRVQRTRKRNDSELMASVIRGGIRGKRT